MLFRQDPRCDPDAFLKGTQDEGKDNVHVNLSVSQKLFNMRKNSTLDHRKLTIIKGTIKKTAIIKL